MVTGIDTDLHQISHDCNVNTIKFLTCADDDCSLSFTPLKHLLVDFGLFSVVDMWLVTCVFISSYKNPLETSSNTVSIL